MVVFLCNISQNGTVLKRRAERRRGFSPEIYVGCGLVNKASTNETKVILLGYPRYPKLPNRKVEKYDESLVSDQGHLSQGNCY